ncbi:MAG: hypothetical protein RR448_09865 [Niameybacter sp.]
MHLNLVSPTAAPKYLLSCEARHPSKGDEFIATIKNQPKSVYVT